MMVISAVTGDGSAAGAAGAASAGSRAGRPDGAPPI